MRNMLVFTAALAITAGCNKLMPAKQVATETRHPVQEIPTISPDFYNQQRADGKFVLSCRQLAIAKASIHSKNALNPQAERVVESHLRAIRAVLLMRCGNRPKTSSVM